MAAPVYATDLTDILADMASTTGWTALGGGAAGLTAPETDFFIQGSNCISKAGWSTAMRGMIYNHGSGVTTPTDGAVLIWVYYWAPNSLDTFAGASGGTGGGLQLVIGSGAAAYYGYNVAGSDTLPFGGWVLAAVDPNTASADQTVGSPSGTEQYFGAVADVPGAGPSKGNPLGIDAMRYGRCRVDYTNGDSGNGYATFDGAQSYGDNVTRRWGLLSKRDGAYFMSGFHSLGTTGTSVDFRDSNRIIFIRDHTKVTSAFNRIEVMNASSNVDWDNIQITALGTQSKGTFVVTAGAFDAVNCQFTDMNTFTFLDSSSATSCIFRRCGQITAPGADLRDSTVTGYTGAADTSAVVWNVNQDPDGELDNMTFVKGTNAHHAIQLGASSPATVTLRGITFTGFNVSNEQNDSVIQLADTGSNRAWTINAVGCTGTVSVKKTRVGDTYTVVADPVTYTVLVTTTSGTPIQNARVYVTAAAGGPNSVGTVIISGLTDVNGLISDTRTYASDQPVTGWVRKASGAPYYKEGLVAATIDSVAGASTTVQLILDQ